jgi:hypothetical protein
MLARNVRFEDAQENVAEERQQMEADYERETLVRALKRVDDEGAQP